jgi:hypothetical protein
MDFPFLYGIVNGTRANHTYFPAEDAHHYTKLFWRWITLRTVVWTAIASLTMFNPAMDTVEMLSWGREWAWGYYKHPPMPAWIAEIATFLAGGAIAGVYLASHLVTALCFWAVWRLGCEMLSARAGFFAALSLEGLVYYNYMANDIGHGVLLAGTSAITTLFFLWTLRSRKTSWWIALGVAMGFTMLSKYSSAFLLIPMILFLFHPACRSCWKTSGPYLAAATALAVFGPHLVWCVQNDFGPVRYILTRSTEKGHSWLNHLYFPLYFTYSQLWRLLPIFAILVPITTWRWRFRKLAPEEGFHRDFLLAIVLGPFLVHLVVSLVLGVEVRDLWGHHLWSFIGLFMLFFLQTRESTWSFAWSGRVALAVTILFMGFTIVQNRVAPHFDLTYQTHLPGQPIAQAVDERWRQLFDSNVPIVASEDMFLTTSVCWYVKGRPASCMLTGHHETPWAEDEELNTRGGVILWDAKVDQGELPAELQKRFPRAFTTLPVDVHFHMVPNVPLRFGVAIVPPSTCGSPFHSLSK